MSLEPITKDTIQCNFFLKASNTDSVFLEELCDSVNKTIQKLSEGYIWHQDEFKVFVPLNKEKHDCTPELVSTTCFGDNIEDEWFIVYLILEVTKRHSNLIVQVQDNDGDFLLIEAADFLPTWANPDTTQNRVFIYQNNIHIIPPSTVDIDTELNTIDAINIIANKQEETKSSEIQQAILNRIGNSPEITENIHRALVKLPLDVATLLTLKPSFVSPIVSSYCDHDILEARVCKNVTVKDRVTVQVKFTKCLYAMLTHSKLMRTLKYAHVDLNDKKSVLGLKLTCGYEMIMSKLKGDIFSSKEYTKFIKHLNDNGYFRDNIERSKEHTRLLEKAKEFYMNMECPINSQLGNAITQIMHTEEFITLKESLKNTQGSEKELVEDNDDWLNIHPDELNNLLNTRYGKKPTFKNDDVITSESITSKLSNFLKETSDFEGIETGEEKQEDNEIEFDSDMFVNSLKNMLNIINDGDDGIGADSDSSYDMDGGPAEDNLNEEIRTKLLSNINNTSKDSQNIISNMIQSLKEEQGASGPTSNILRAIGINKTNVLDSDDDDEL